MTQFGPEADSQLNQLSHTVGEKKAFIELATKEHDDAWKEIFSIFDEFVGHEPRFLANDGYYLYRQTRQASPKLDEAKLKRILFERLPEEEASLVWNAITEQRVNTTFLEAAVQKKAISAAMVDECITTPKPTENRIRQPWTAEDKIKAQVLGLTIAEELTV